MASTPWLEGIEAIVFVTVGDQPSLFESVLPPELLRLPEELLRIDDLLDDPAFFEPFVDTVHAVLRPSTGSPFDADGDLPPADVPQVPLAAGI